MATSTTNLLTVLNEVLLNIGAVASFNSTQTQATAGLQTKALNAVKRAYQDIFADNDWSWTHLKINAVSWNAERATLGEYNRLRNVQFDNRDNITFVDERQFDLLQPLTPYIGSKGQPAYYTIENDTVVRINPYPNDAASRAKIWFYVVQHPPFPVLFTNVFSIPEDAVPLIIKRASANLALSHLDSNTTRNMFLQDYQRHLEKYTRRDKRVPTTGGNMFRKRG